MLVRVMLWGNYVRTRVWMGMGRYVIAMPRGHVCSILSENSLTLHTFYSFLIIMYISDSRNYC